MCKQWRLAFEEPAAMFSTFGYFFRSVSPRVFLLENDQWNRPRDFPNPKYFCFICFQKCFFDGWLGGMAEKLYLCSGQ